MFHSVTINGKNTWDNYHMVPANGIYLPTPPEQKRTTIDLKTGNGLLDVSTVLTGYPLFQNRSGELQYFILDPWDLEEQGIGGALNLEKVKARIKKNFSSSYIDTFFNNLQNFVYDDNTFPTKFVTVVYGINERQTAIGVVTVSNSSSRIYVKSDGRIQTDSGGNVNCGYLTTNGSFLGYKDFRDGWGQIVNTSSSDWIAPFSFNNVPTTGSSTSYVASYLPFSNTTNAEYNGSNGMTSWINSNVYSSSSSTNLVYGKSFYKTILPPALHTVTSAYDVYSQILNDIHGQTGTMIFEDDPYWYYQGNFTVKSMDTNSVRRGVVIGYDVAPYKLRTAQAAKILNSIDASTWASLTINEDELFSMPVIPSVNVSGTFNSESAVIRFVKPNGTYVEKTVTSSGTHTWPDVVFYKQATVQFKASAGKTVTMTFRPGRL